MELVTEMAMTQIGTGLSPTCVTQASTSWSSVVKEARFMGETSLWTEKVAMGYSAL